MSPSCKRSWEVEAARDGRLQGNEQLSIERHVEGCRECAAEQYRLNVLAARLQALPVVEPDQLQLRRRRQELLARAASESSPEGAGRASQKRVWIGLLVAGLAVLLGFGLRTLLDGQDSQRAFLLLQATPGTVYAQQASADKEVVTLTEGQLTFDVQHGEERRSVLVKTPDGEVEDVGTVFTVAVVDGRTHSITVAEGRVVVRVAAQPEHWIESGETYLPYPALTAEDTTLKDVRTESAAPGAQLKERGQHGSAATKAHASVRAPGAPEQSNGASRARTQGSRHASNAADNERPQATGAQASSLLDSFARAVERVEGHDDGVALELLDQFLAHHPSDARAEDAAFLRVVVLARSGSAAVARSAARTYLTRYPQGFRAQDVQRLLDQTLPAAR
jgi:hypothetical protein